MHTKEIAALNQRHVGQIKMLVDEMAQLKAELRSFLMQEKEKARSDEASFRDQLTKETGWEFDMCSCNHVNELRIALTPSND